MESSEKLIYKSPENLSAVAAVRKRPGMYVGSVDFFGFVHYLVCPFSLLLSRCPGWIEVNVLEGGFEINSDASLGIKVMDDGTIFPFETFDGEDTGPQGFEGPVLNALSATLEVRAATATTLHELSYQRGQRISHSTSQTIESSTRLSFTPDASIFRVMQISPAIFESYLRRMSFLHRGVRFRLTIGGETQEFYSESGIRALFDAIASPYQLLHEPVHVTAEEGELRLELVMAYQSWSDELTWCFINNGRAVEGGTHEDGLRQGLRKLRTKLELPDHFQNGAIVLMSLVYPQVVWQGCIKSKIGSPELKKIVSRLVVDKVTDWFQSRPEVHRQVQELRIFTFPEDWSR